MVQIKKPRSQYKKKEKQNACYLILSRKLKTRHLKSQTTNNTVHIANTYKYLRVLLDLTLSLHKHVDTTYKKAAGCLYLLRRIRPHLTTKVAITIFKTILIPLFTYCSIIISSYTNTIETSMKNFKKRANLIILQ